MKTMLVVDDSAFFRTLIRSHVGTLDVEIVGEAENGNEGFEKYKELMPDIVTMDLAMEEGSGIEALDKIMQHNPDAFVIVVSSTTGQPTVLEEATALGAKKIFDKPLKKDEFIEYIRGLLG